MAETDALPADLVIAAYGDRVPCLFELTPEGCTERAKHIVTFKHSDGTRACIEPEKYPVRHQHKELFRQALTGFWADLMPTKSKDCGKVLRLGTVSQINAT